MTSYSKHYNTTLKCDDIIYYPISLRNNKFPLSPKIFTYQVKNKHSDSTKNIDDIKVNADRVHITYKLNAPQQELASFGIWGRIFTRDVKTKYNPSKEDKEKYIEIENVIYNTEKKKSLTD